MRALRILRTSGIVILLGLTYFAVPVSTDASGGMVLRSLGAAVLMAALALLVVLQVRHALAEPDSAVDGLATAIALVWVVFALTAYVVQLHRPGEFSGASTRLDTLYFSASTMLTIGYGDVHAVGQLARGIVLTQMVFDVVFVATAAAILGSRIRRQAERRAAERSSSGHRDDSSRPPAAG